MPEPRRWTIRAIDWRGNSPRAEVVPPNMQGGGFSSVEVVEASAYDEAATGQALWRHNAEALEAVIATLRDGLAEQGFTVGRNPDGVDDTIPATLLIVRDLAARVEGLVKSQELAVLDRNEAEDENVRLAARVEQLEGYEKALRTIRDGRWNQGRPLDKSIDAREFARRVLSEGEGS